MKIKHLITYSLLALVCASCGENSVASKGYQKYKDMNTNYMISIGGSGKEIKYNSCSYAYITGDGSLSAESLKDSIYYCANWTMTLGYESANSTEYFVYYKNTKQIVILDDSLAYSYACDLIIDGSLSGKLGRL